MRPDDAYALLRQLRDLYDVLDVHLAGAQWAEAAALVPQRQAIEDALRPFALARQTATSEDAVDWAPVDALASELDARQTEALRRTRAACDATAAQLARLHASRSSAARYQDAGSRAPIFASRRA